MKRPKLPKRKKEEKVSGAAALEAIEAAERRVDEKLARLEEAEKRALAREAATRDVAVDERLREAERRALQRIADAEARVLALERRPAHPGAEGRFVPMTPAAHDSFMAAMQRSPSHLVAADFEKRCADEARALRADPGAPRQCSIDYTQPAPWWIERNQD